MFSSFYSATLMATTHKFGAPLYCSAWLSEELLVFGGGGGKKSSGIANRLVVAKWADGALSPEPVVTFSTGPETPQRCVALGQPALLLTRRCIAAASRFTRTAPRSSARSARACSSCACA